MPYFTGSGAATVATLTAFGRTLIDDADAATARGTLGLGTIATQAANSVAITGGSVTGITDLAVADGGTGASTAAAARTNLGAVGKYAANCTAAASQTITAATHGLGTGQDKQVQIYTVASTYDMVQADVQINASTGDVTIIFATAPTAGQYRIVIMG
jgi:hypothetical protein